MRRLQDDGRVWVAPATVDGKVGLRPCFVNFRTTDDDVRVLVDIAAELGGRLGSHDGGSHPQPGRTSRRACVRCSTPSPT